MNGKHVYRCRAYWLPVDDGPLETCDADTDLFIVSDAVGDEFGVCKTHAVEMYRAHRLLFGYTDLRRQVSKMVERWGSQQVNVGEL